MQKNAPSWAAHRNAQRTCAHTSASPRVLSSCVRCHTYPHLEIQLCNGFQITLHHFTRINKLQPLPCPCLQLKNNQTHRIGSIAECRWHTQSERQYFQSSVKLYISLILHQNLTSGSFSKVSCSYGSLQPYQCTFCVVTASNVNGLFMHAQYHRWVIWKMLGPLSYMDPPIVDTF